MSDGGLTLDLTVMQETGNSVRWILSRKCKPKTAISGTPENPQFGTSLLEHNVSKTDNERIASLLQELSLLARR